jgi:hypothetical protein
MYHFKICNRIKLVCFLKFVVHEINSEIVLLTEREKTDITEANVTVGWLLQSSRAERKGERKLTQSRR